MSRSRRSIALRAWGSADRSRLAGTGGSGRSRDPAKSPSDALQNDVKAAYWAARAPTPEYVEWRRVPTGRRNRTLGRFAEPFVRPGRAVKPPFFDTRCISIDPTSALGCPANWGAPSWSDFSRGLVSRYSRSGWPQRPLRRLPCRRSTRALRRAHSRCSSVACSLSWDVASAID
jgi:hypothetical protein